MTYQVQLASITNDVSDDCQINSVYSLLFFETILSNLFPTSGKNGFNEKFEASNHTTGIS